MASRWTIVVCFLSSIGHMLLSLAEAKHQPLVEAFFQGHCMQQLSPCHQDCIDLPQGGYKCACRPGFTLHSNGFSCLVVESPPPTSTLPPEFQKIDGDEKVLYDDNIDQYAKEISGVAATASKSEDFTPSDIEKTLQNLAAQKLMRTNSANDGMLGDDPNNYNDLLSELDDDESSEDEDLLVSKKGLEHRGGRKKGRRKGGKSGHRRKEKNKWTDTQLSDAVPNTPPSGLGYSKEEPIEFDNVIYPNGKPMYQACRELKCKPGGRCVNDNMRGGVRCQCRLGTEGEFCEKNVMVRYPKFMGTGYMAFPVLRGAYREFTITVEIRPDTGNGMLLFSSEYPNARADFFSVTLVDGYAQFRFDCGTGMAEITTNNKVELGQWNKITVHRVDWSGWIQLNDGVQARGKAKGMFSRITFREDLYLGGYKNTSMIGGRTGMRWGFVGCVRSLEVNNKVYDMRKGAYVGDAIHGMDVGECSTHVCDNVKCENGGTCTADSADTSVCLCPLGKAGDRCENRIDIQVPSFNGNSYLQFIGLRHTVLSYAAVEIVFKPVDGDGLIFYNGYSTDRSGDFISLSLVGGYLEFRFDLGTGPAIIRSREPLPLNEWHDVHISRTGRNGWMRVDNQLTVEGMAKGAYTQLTLILDLFIGGHRNFDEVAQNVNIRKAFKGCIQKVMINDRPLKLVEEVLTGVNVDNCNHPCLGQPCLNGGRCIPIRDFYKCSCPLGFENNNCEDTSLAPHTPPSTGKARYRYRYRRDVKEPIKTPMFSGESYLMYTITSSPELIKRVRGSKIDIQIKFRAMGPNGLLFWTGEEDMQHNSDYLALGIKDGRMQFRYNLGSGEVIITYNETRVTDGKWHKVRAQRYEKVGYLELDGTEVVEGSSKGSLKQLNTGTSVYIGGLDDVKHSTARKFSSGFVGCVQKVTLATDYKLDLISEAFKAQNIIECS